MLACCVGWSGAAWAAALPAPAVPDAWQWRRSELPLGGEQVRAVAVDLAGRRLAVADENGVMLHDLGWPVEAGGAAVQRRRRSGMGVVHDLYFAPDGALWIAAAEGLWRWDAAGRLAEHPPGPSEHARFVRRVVGRPGLLVAATEAGAFVSGRGRTWQRIVHGLPAGPVSAVALRMPTAPSQGGPSLDGSGQATQLGSIERVDIWLITAGEVWRVEASLQSAGADASTGEGIALSTATRERIPGRPASDGPVDLAADLPGTALAVLYPQALARLLRTAGVERRWEVGHPTLLPGASARRLSGAGDAAWLGTDSGLLVAATAAGPWHRASAPAGGAPSSFVIAGRERLYLAGGRALLEARRVSLLGAAGDAPRLTPRPMPRVPRDPVLQHVHEQALEHTGLAPGYFRRLRRSLRRRGWLPALSLRAAAGYDHDTSDDRDQTFTYGALHDLRDRRSLYSRDYAGSLSLTWDLGDIVYNPEAPDLSREVRQVITLRDNMLDEINQLYFDRRRALFALAAYADRSDPEAVALLLRSEELAAGLDAWTGGWFSEHVERTSDEGREPTR
jgi:hypothetical protein